MILLGAALMVGGTALAATAPAYDGQWVLGVLVILAGYLVIRARAE